MPSLIKSPNQRNTSTSVSRSSLCLLALLGSGLALATTGCGLGTSGEAVTGAGGAGSSFLLSGSVHGGQQPVSGATIQLYAVGTGGYGSAATPLISSTVLTGAAGQFAISNLYTCPTGSMVYITATQGNPGLGTGANNSAIALMAGLGSCANLKANAATTTININELTTVASVYALSGFLTGISNAGTTTANAAGLTQAFATENVLVNTGSGTVPGIAPPAGITLPTIAINTLADSIATCINSTGPTSSACSALFTAATPVGGSAPADTIAALANIAHNPGLNVSAIYLLSSAAAPFQPTLTSAPSDWTMSIGYTGGGLALPNGVAIDAAGHAWIANEGGNAVTELASGSFLSGTTGFTSTSIVGPRGIAVDASGNVWVANTGANNLLELSSLGVISNTITTGISGPVSVALDTPGNVWVTNFNSDSVAKFSSAGVAASGSPYTATGLTEPTGIAIDSSNNVWIASSSGANLTLLNSSGVRQNNYTDGLLIAPGGVATDSVRSKIWTAATGINAISGVTSSGTAVTGGPYAGGGIMQPLSVALDGAGNIWTANNAVAGSVSAYTTAGTAKTPVTGFGVLNQPVGLALDGSGNLWVTASGSNSVTEFIGLGVATLTPLVSSSR